MPVPQCIIYKMGMLTVAASWVLLSELVHSQGWHGAQNIEMLSVNLVLMVPRCMHVPSPGPAPLLTTKKLCISNGREDAEGIGQEGKGTLMYVG